MTFPTWPLLVFCILVLAILLISMFPILAIVVPVSVAIWLLIAAHKVAATRRISWRSERTRFKQLLLLTDRQERGRRSLVTPMQPSPQTAHLGTL
jgi:hypothetical protein